MPRKLAEVRADQIMLRDSIRIGGVDRAVVALRLDDRALMPRVEVTLRAATGELVDDAYPWDYRITVIREADDA